MKIKPMIRSNICLNAHPIGCKKAVEDQIEYTKIRRREREEKNPETADIAILICIAIIISGITLTYLNVRKMSELV